MKSLIDAQISQIEKEVKRNSPEAIDHATNLIVQFPDYAKVWSLRAYIYARAGNLQAAISDLNHAIEKSASEPGLFFDRGRYFAQSGNYQCAIQDFTAGLIASELLNEQYYTETLYFLRADAYLHTENKRDAISDLQHVGNNFSLWTTTLLTKEMLLNRAQI